MDIFGIKYIYQIANIPGLHNLSIYVFWSLDVRYWHFKKILLLTKNSAQAHNELWFFSTRFQIIYVHISHNTYLKIADIFGIKYISQIADISFSSFLSDYQFYYYTIKNLHKFFQHDCQPNCQNSSYEWPRRVHQDR